MAGLTMIEILVTLIILSIGLLGMAALQLSGIRSVNSSTYRTQATLLADDIAERMRANTTAVDANSFAAINSAAINCTTVPNPYCGEYYDGSANVAAQSCTAAQMATYDINVWFCGERYGSGRRNGLQALLSQATAAITCTDVNPTSGADADACTDRVSYHTITINWNELNPNRSTGAAANLTQSISIMVQQ
jgi:type IV pilus assembly protein PilV